MKNCPEQSEKKRIFFYVLLIPKIMFDILFFCIWWLILIEFKHKNFLLYILVKPS